MISHKTAAKMHCADRIRRRLNRKPDSLDIDKMRLALTENNSDCFLRRVYPDSITGIIKYQNIWTVAVFNKSLGVVSSVGVSL